MRSPSVWTSANVWRAHVAATVLLLAGCVGSGSTVPGPSLADATSNFETSAQDVKVGGVDTKTAELPKVVTADTAASGTDVPDGCTCAGMECGNPPGCPGLQCSECPLGALCTNNLCVADPNCTCAGLECGIMEGCGKDCGTCPAPATCNNFKCELDCSCATTECGKIAGCPNGCGDCEKGKLCVDNVCKADPKCVCKPGMCDIPLGCAQNCGSCVAGEKCVANKCTAGGDDCPCNSIACGFAKPSCTKSCGSCQINQICSSNACKAVTDTTKKKFGEPCGPTEACPQPPVGAGYFAQKQFVECQHNQCGGSLCFGNVCSQKCKIAADQVSNATGAAGPDGIEDPGQPSDCVGASSGPSGSGFRCVEQNSPAQVLAGQTDQVCLPGNAFAPCQADGDCPAGEVCRVYPLLSNFQSRCGPKMSNPIGTAGVKGSQYCNINPTVGPVAACETGWCGENGCNSLCKTDADCKTLPGACKSGQCTALGAACKADAECPVWKCKAGIQFSQSSTTKFSVCQP